MTDLRHVPLPALALLVLSATACNRTTVTAAPQFPSERKLEQIQEAPPPSPAEIFRDTPAPVDHWQLATPLPTLASATPYDGPDPELRQLAQRHAKRRRVTEGMSCYAREQGRFWLAHHDSPPEDVDRFVSARCGTAAVRIQTRYQYRERTPGQPAPTLASSAAVIDELIASAPAEALVGAWAGASEREEIFAVSTAVPELELEPLPLALAQPGFVDVRGTLPGAPGWVHGVVTRGERGYAYCEPRPDHGKEVVSLRCPVSATDDHAMIEVYGAAPNEVLGHLLATLMAFPSVSPAAPASGGDPMLARVAEYRAAPLSLPVDPQDHSITSYLTAINHLRGQQGMSPLTLAEPQSEVVAGLLPHFLAARGQGDGALAEQIALGLMAGWKVQGTIRDASLLSFGAPRAWSVERDLAAALLSPSYRSTVFDRDDRLIALGVLDGPREQGRAFMLLTYQLFEARSYAPERTALLAELDRQRERRGLPPVQRIEGPRTDAVFDESVARIQRGEAEPEDELGRVLEAFVEGAQRSFQGQVISTLVLEGWQPDFPRDLLQAEQPWVAMMVTYRKAPGSAWGEHVVMLLYSTSG